MKVAVLKQSTGASEPYDRTKLGRRLMRSSEGLSVDYQRVLELVEKGLPPPAVKSSDIDKLVESTAVSLSSADPDYERMALNVAVSRLRKQTSDSFVETVRTLYQHKPKPLVCRALYEICTTFPSFATKIEAAMDYTRDYELAHVGLETLKRSYLLCNMDRQTIERPQHMWMRVALGVWLCGDKEFVSYFDDEDKLTQAPKGTVEHYIFQLEKASRVLTLSKMHLLDKAIEMYHDLSLGRYTHATPTLFHAGTPNFQGASCFLLNMVEDSIDGIYKTIWRTARISQAAGGVGLNVADIRGKESHIAGTNGKSNGLVPMLRVFNDTARYVDQCFTADAQVLTRDYGYIPIFQIKPGDYVLTGVGEYAPVAKVLKHPIKDDNGENAELWCINEWVRVTGMHQVLTRDTVDGVNEYREVNSLNPRLDMTMMPKVDYPEYMRERHFRLLGIMCRAVPKYDLSVLDFNPLNFRRPRDVFKWTLHAFKTMFPNVEFSVSGSRKNPIITFRSLFPFYRHVFGLTFFPVAETIPVPSYREAFLEGMNAIVLDDNVIEEDKSYNYFAIRNIVPPAAQHVDDEEEEEETFLYDLEIASEEGNYDHSYCVQGLGVVHNGGGKRKGAFAIYIEPWHVDIFDVLDLKKNTGAEELRARDLHYAMWIPDLFMRRVFENGDWTLFCPNECPGLTTSYGPDFERLYLQYESELEKFRVARRIRASELWERIMVSIIETSGPYMMSKDAVNHMSHFKHWAVTRGANLCAEITQPCRDSNEVQVCNLASIILSSFVQEIKQQQQYLVSETSIPNAVTISLSRSALYFDFAELGLTVRKLVRNLNQIIDHGTCPLPEAKETNLRHRPMGIGVQGLQDVFFKMNMPFESEEARRLNHQIFECIYYHAEHESMLMAKELEEPYETFAGSPASQGKLQPHLYLEFMRNHRKGGAVDESRIFSGRYDFAELARDIQKYGKRNSVLIALMPTASTAQFRGQTECFEVQTNNIFSRSLLSGTHVLVNRYLVKRLQELGLWSESLKDEIIRNDGSIQSIASIPQDVKNVFKTVWEVKQRRVLEMAADRTPFVCQSQSLNISMAQPTVAKLNALYELAYNLGLTTWSYYVHRRPAAEPIQFTIAKKKEEENVCSRDNKEGCLSCGS